MRSCHVYKDILKIISELPYSPEKVFAKIDMPRGRKALTWMVTPSVGSKQPACTASLAALIEAEAVFRIMGFLDLVTT